jgi:hypothetical protein
MKRVIAFVLLIMLVVTAPAFAADGDSSGAPPALARAVAAKHDFSAGAAGISRLAQETARKNDVARAVAVSPPAPTPAPAQASGGKSFWGTPWPYVIAGGAILAIIVVAKNSEGGIY